MTVSKETKLRWFDQGASAVADVWPELDQQTDVPVYICPQCFDGRNLDNKRVCFRSAIESKDLTAEHVPAQALEGKELLLTCADCNHTAGSRIESHARKRENLAVLRQSGEWGPRT